MVQIIKQIESIQCEISKTSTQSITIPTICENRLDPTPQELKSISELTKTDSTNLKHSVNFKRRPDHLLN